METVSHITRGAGRADRPTGSGGRVPGRVDLAAHAQHRLDATVIAEHPLIGCRYRRHWRWRRTALIVRPEPARFPAKRSLWA